MLTRSLLIACLLAPSAAQAAAPYATFNGTELKIGNALIERRWVLQNGLLHPAAFRDLRISKEWSAGVSPQPAPYPVSPLAAETRRVTFSSKTGVFAPTESESLVAELVSAGNVTLTYRFQVFAKSTGVSVQLGVTGLPATQAAAPGGSTKPTTGVEKETLATASKIVTDVMDALTLAPPHLKLTQVRLYDQTDVHDELVTEREWLLHPSERVREPGNLFYLEDTSDGSGLIFLKEAPLPHARPVPNAIDLDVATKTGQLALLGQGRNDDGWGYRSIALAYTGGRAGRIEALQLYQRQLRQYDSKRDAMFLSNTWGDRSRDARINSAFMEKEVEAGARLGVDAIQIDDGWQRGRTANSAKAGGVWNGFWAADPHFWDINAERFPQGLDPLIAAAKQNGMQFGLWFAPDSSNDFTNWERDAARILELHRTQGIRYFKIDGVKAITRKSEENLRRFFDRVLAESQGKVTFDLDVTAEIRPGYFGMMNVGPIFVENRYTDWHSYWPHQTLRNLWKLAQYVDPLRLRMEFLNNTRHPEMYPNDPLAPARYSPAYLFAITMFANPLGWFEISNLPASYFEQIPSLVSTWKQERGQMFSGTTIPIGAAPDGRAWTGFASISEDRGSAYALVFREDNADAQWSEKLPLIPAADYNVRVLSGKGDAQVQGGILQVQIPDARNFLWLRLQRRP